MNTKPKKVKTRLVNARLLAVQALAEVLDEGKSLSECSVLNRSEALTGQAKDRPRSAGREFSQARHLAYGVLRWQVALAWLEAQLLRKPLNQKDRVISHLLWLGLFQLWQDRTPDHAAINETTECTRQLGKEWATGMVNAVLRRFQREQQSLLERLAKVPEHWAHPTWLLNTIQQDWPHDWPAILAANNQSPPLWVRVNTQRAPLREVESRLVKAGFGVEHNAYVKEALLLSPAAPIDELPGFAEGHFSVQDAAAQMAADLLDVKVGMHVLDACAAPGGKTCHLLEANPEIHLTAVERYPNRLRRIQENLDRLQLKCHLVAADAADTATWWDGQAFERILLDVPCTALGVIRRHPEIRHLRSDDQLLEAVILQEKLLRQIWPLLAPGGLLLYATCSLSADENSNQITNFLSEHEDAEERGIAADWGRAQPHGRQILPGEGNMDGFYYALLQKQA